VTRNMPEPNPGPFLLGPWSASAPWCQRRSCSLGCACSMLTPATHWQESPGPRPSFFSLGTVQTEWVSVWLAEGHAVTSGPVCPQYLQLKVTWV
jgi:hypothetical protein